MDLSPEDEAFLLESNRIEGILRPLRPGEQTAFLEFMELKKIEIADIIYYVQAIQPDARLRDRKGLDVTVGNHIPPAGGQAIVYKLDDLIERITENKIDPFYAHIEYEMLHPFTDGNGRSGRMLWYWMMRGSKIGFLHSFYYQTLNVLRELLEKAERLKVYEKT